MPSSSSSDTGSEQDEDGDGKDLPFPTALSRKDFLAPTFDATTYLSSLFPSEDGSSSAQRHQTLEDLRTELRERSSAISAELLELVNANYTRFLSLGDELKGGDERVEDVRVALFGFRRSIEDVQKRVRERRVAVGDGCRELGEVRSSIQYGRRLLELDERVAQLEDRLAIAGTGSSNAATNNSSNNTKAAMAGEEAWDFEDESEEEEDEDQEIDGVDECAPGEAPLTFVASSPVKLAALARDLVLAHRLADAVGHHVPLVKKMDDRLAQCQSTLLLDLSSAVREARKASKTARGQARLLKLLAVYRVLDCEEEIVRVLTEK